MRQFVLDHLPDPDATFPARPAFVRPARPGIRQKHDTTPDFPKKLFYSKAPYAIFRMDRVFLRTSKPVWRYTMKKFATLAAAAALAATAAAPVAAQDANVDADPFVSSQGSLALAPGLVAAGIAIAVVAIAAIDSSDGT